MLLAMVGQHKATKSGILKCSIFFLDVAIPGKVSLRWCLPLSSAASPLDRMVLLKWYRQYVDEAFLMLSRLDMSCCP